MSEQKRCREEKKKEKLAFKCNLVISATAAEKKRKEKK